MVETLGALLKTAFSLARETASRRLLLFLDAPEDCLWLLRSSWRAEERLAVVVPRGLEAPGDFEDAFRGRIIRSWSGNQSRFSRIKYALLAGVMRGTLDPDERIVCVLGPAQRSHWDTITVHDLEKSWSEDFPFDPRRLVSKTPFETVMAVLDIALDIGTTGREGHPVGTIFVVGDSEAVLRNSRQAVFNPFLGYSVEQRRINRGEVIESVKELAKLDGAFVVSADGVVEAAGRHLQSVASPESPVPEQDKGFGSRHRSASAITAATGAVAVVVSQSTGRVTIFEKGGVVATLEPVLGRGLE